MIIFCLSGATKLTGTIYILLMVLPDWCNNPGTVQWSPTRGEERQGNCSGSELRNSGFLYETETWLNCSGYKLALTFEQCSPYKTMHCFFNTALHNHSTNQILSISWILQIPVQPAPGLPSKQELTPFWRQRRTNNCQSRAESLLPGVPDLWLWAAFCWQNVMTSILCTSCLWRDFRKQSEQTHPVQDPVQDPGPLQCVGDEGATVESRA